MQIIKSLPAPFTRKAETTLMPKLNMDDRHDWLNTAVVVCMGKVLVLGYVVMWRGILVGLDVMKFMDHGSYTYFEVRHLS